MLLESYVYLFKKGILSPGIQSCAFPSVLNTKCLFRWVVAVIGALQRVYRPYRSLVEALYTLNSALHV